ncbi:MAG TPA: 2-phospho-L-lactate transferase [Terriglobales bacterium]|nr:2-phospho-L-lactate transferase [Terriglobales bacterium]
MITVFSGGTGGAKFIQGLSRVVPPENLSIIVNTGDDLTWWGLHVSPDLDSVMYGLAGILSPERGWGIDGETFACLETARRLGLPAWFQLGDRDLALHLARTEMLRSGRKLDQATVEIAQCYGIRTAILPMSNDRVETRVLTDGGELSFQEYFVREHYRPEPLGVRFVGAEDAQPAPGVLRAIAEAEAILIAPSNPITSIGPILSVPGIREAIRQTQAPIAAISPIVGNAAVSGPAAALMRCAGLDVSCRGVASAYRDFLNVLIADDRDRNSDLAPNLNIPVHFCDTMMTSDEVKTELARETLSALKNFYYKEVVAS